MWNAQCHSHEENIQYCWLRAVEWDGWPLFMSQPIVPILLNYFPWWEIIVGFVIVELAWAVFIRTNFVSLWLADVGPLFVALKWVICPVMGYILYNQGQVGLALLALLWPLVMMLIVKMMTVYLKLILIPHRFEVSTIGIIQRALMEKMGYRPTE